MRPVLQKSMLRVSRPYGPKMLRRFTFFHKIAAKYYFSRMSEPPKNIRPVHFSRLVSFVRKCRPILTGSRYRASLVRLQDMQDVQDGDSKHAKSMLRGTGRDHEYILCQS